MIVKKFFLTTKKNWEIFSKKFKMEAIEFQGLAQPLH